MEKNKQLETPPNGDGGGDENVTLSKVEYQELVTSSAKAKQDVANVVDEIKNLRREKHELAERLKAQDTPPSDVEAAVEAVIAKREAESVKSIFEQATNKFLASHQEFSIENDPGGVKLADFQKNLSRMNLVGLKTEGDFLEILSDAYNLMASKSGPQRPVVPVESRGGGVVVKSTDGTQLTPQEEKMVKQSFGGDVNSYLKQKAKRPEYFEELLKWQK